ncbi:unnamed protein product [Timema podura]|uniref:Uncharacterized protein n=1 Tax=Timema podura TaxID=61482 RepID=A0ABN7NKK2_TIMPD|nr:unnamed protein product [Timema podura]
MACGRPLFPGSTVEEELRLIFRTLGSPSEDFWGRATLSYSLPHYSPEPLLARAPRLDTDAVDLLTKFLCYEAKHRVSAVDAMKHNYFMSLGPEVLKLPDGKPPQFTCSRFQLLSPRLSSLAQHETSVLTNYSAELCQFLLFLEFTCAKTLDIAHQISPRQVVGEELVAKVCCYE